MQSASNTIVVLGTGGTIAGTAATSGDDINYAAGQIAVADLVAGVPALACMPLECEQVAQIDSKDMSFEVWSTLAQRVAHHVARAEVAGIVIAHGTDTLEETAYFLQRLLAPDKPVAISGAMRPATATRPDGPQNLLDAVTVASHAGAAGVVAVMAGEIHSAIDVRKTHTTRIDAFSSGDGGPLGRVEQGRVSMLRPWPQGQALGIERLGAAPPWPRVEIVYSHAGADGRVVDALLAQGVDGIVVAATGNGTVHGALEASLVRAQAEGVTVLRSTRVGAGAVQPRSDDIFPGAGTLTPVQARIELMLQRLVFPPSPGG
jgi:L-asparaginase